MTSTITQISCAVLCALFLAVETGYSAPHQFTEYRYTDKLSMIGESWSVDCMVIEVNDTTVVTLFPSSNTPVILCRSILHTIENEDGLRLMLAGADSGGKVIPCSRLITVKGLLSLDTLLIEGGKTIKLLGVGRIQQADSVTAGEYRNGLAFIQNKIKAGTMRYAFDRQWRSTTGVLQGYIFLDDTTVLNAELLRGGYVQFDSAGAALFKNVLRAAEDEARRAQRGIWSRVTPVSTQQSQNVQKQSPSDTSRMPARQTPPAQNVSTTPQERSQTPRPGPPPPKTWDIKNIKPSFILNHTYLDNWLSGGAEAFSYQFITYTDFSINSSWARWDNLVDTKYGQSRIGKGEAQITLNQIFLRSDFIFKQERYVNPFIGGSIRTQITTGYRYYEGKPRIPQSAFWDPVAVTYKFGIDVKLIKDLDFKVSADFSDELGNKYVKEARIDDKRTPKIEKRKITKKSAAFIKYNHNFFQKKISLISTADIRSPFKNYSETTLIDWTNVFTYNFIRFIGIRIDSHIVIDKLKTRNAQFQNITGITLTYDFRDLFQQKK